MLKKSNKNSGMSLIEVIVSMLVLSIAAVTVISAFSMAAQVNTKAKRQQRDRLRRLLIYLKNF